MKKLTILTRPTGVPPVVTRKYGGHVGVTRSLIEGLDKIGYNDFNYAPDDEGEIAEHVHVLAGVNTLQYAIGLKKSGKIKKLTAGPNIVVFSDEYDALITDGEIERYLTPSDWNKRLFLEMTPELEGRIFSWPAGVDTEYFKPDDTSVRDNTVIVYHKCQSDQFRYKICCELRKHGFDPVVFRYGGRPQEFYRANDAALQVEKYNMEDFKEALGKACFAVVISDSESQGIALAEMWSMDVPTICFDPQYYMWEWGGRMIERDGDVSSCPYLSGKTGMRFGDLRELEEILGLFADGKTQFSPREWVLANMSDEVCAARFLELVGLSGTEGNDEGTGISI